MNTNTRVSVPVRTLIAAALLSALAVTTQPLSGQCALGFLHGTAPVIDGRNAGDWSDASVLSSSSAAGACLSRLLDEDLIQKNVTVYSKTYDRTDGQAYLGLMFEVQDGSITESGGGLLVDGERVVVQLDTGGVSGGTTLEGGDDHRLVVTHRWESSAADPQEVTNVGSTWSTATLASGFCGGGPAWEDSTATPSGYSVSVRKDLPGGYRVELELPASVVGGLGSNFRVAFQVINDWGGSGDPNAAAASFPASLPYSTLENAVDGCNDGGWRTPDDWALAYEGVAPTDVYISRNPVFWNSEDMVALACGSPSYQYHSAKPCVLTLRAQLRKSGSEAETRNVLFLWADHGASPSTWRVIGLKEGVPISGAMTAVESAPWSGVPTGLPNHPCVRVYILPPFFQAAFDREDILAISTPSQLAQMVSVYHVQTQHWAQKNISAATTVPNCPLEGCGIGGMFGGPALALAQSLGRSLAGLTVPQPLTAAPAPAPQREEREQQHVVGRPIWLSKMDRGVLEGQNAFVQLQSIGWMEPGPTDTLGYVLAEPLGGFLQAIPFGLLKERERWPLQFVVGNPGTHARHVFLTLDTEAPSGAPPFNVQVDTTARLMEPGAQVHTKGTVALGSAPPTPPRPGCPPFGAGGGMAAGLGVSLLAFFVFRRRGK